METRKFGWILEETDSPWTPIPGSWSKATEVEECGLIHLENELPVAQRNDGRKG